MEHAKTGLLLDVRGPDAVWKPLQVQEVLVDLVLHEAYVRGNSWGSCHQLLYAVRHYNVQRIGSDPLKDKPRLRQIMDGLKKCKGPKRGKSPVTRAMLLVLDKALKHHSSLEDLKLWAAILLAFQN